MRVPSSLYRHLADCVPEFSGLAERDQESLATMLWMFTDPRRRHERYRGRLSLTKETVERIWGSSERMRRLVRWRYFRVLKGSNLGRGYTHAYFPVADVAEALRRCMVDPAPDEWLDVRGRVTRRLGAPIASMANGGKKHTVWKGLTPANSVPIDLHSLDVFYKQLVRECRGLDPLRSEDEEARVTYIQHRLAAITLLSKLSRNKICPGSVPIRYVQNSTGRLFSDGASLQSVPREVRHAALAGCWDYDISACHWALIAQLVEQHGGACPAIHHYLTNKREVRALIAGGAGISLDDAKSCLSMILYGAPATLYEEASISELIGVRAARKLFSLAAFRNLHRDVARARTLVVNSWPVRAGGWRDNDLGLAIRASAKPRQVLAHLLQGVEAKALMAVVKEYGQRILLCLHDGWVSREQLDIGVLVDLIYRETGYHVEIEEARLGPPLNAGIESVKRSETQQPCGSPADFVSLHPTSSPWEPWPSSSPSDAEIAAAVERETTRPNGGLILDGRPDWNRPPRRKAGDRLL